MTPGAGRARPDRSASGWLFAGQLLLAVLAFFSPQLGVRQGVSTVLPPLRLPLDSVGPALVIDATASTCGGEQRSPRARAEAPEPREGPGPASPAQDHGRGRSHAAPVADHVVCNPTRGPPVVG